MVAFPSQQQENDEAFASLLNRSNASVDARLEMSKKRAYTFTGVEDTKTEKKKKQKRKLLKKLKKLLRRKDKSKNNPPGDGSLLGISSVDQTTKSESRKVVPKIRFPKLRWKHKKDCDDCSDDDNDSNVSEHIKQVMRNLQVENLDSMDFSFSDSEASDNTSSNNSVLGYASLA